MSIEQVLTGKQREYQGKLTVCVFVGVCVCLLLSQEDLRNTGNPFKRLRLKGLSLFLIKHTGTKFMLINLLEANLTFYFFYFFGVCVFFLLGFLPSRSASEKHHY